MSALSEDTLVQATIVDYLADTLGWDSVFAFNSEVLEVEGTGRRRWAGCRSIR